MKQTDERMIARAQRAPWARAVEIAIVSRNNAYRAELVLKPVEPGAFIESTLALPYDDAQTLMDDLWQAGLRPTEGSGSAGSLAATERHLADMRTIAFGKLELKAP